MRGITLVKALVIFQYGKHQEWQGRQYKGALEMWYQEHIVFWTDFMLIFLTAWVIVFPESELVFKVFKDLPKREPVSM